MPESTPAAHAVDAGAWYVGEVVYVDAVQVELRQPAPGGMTAAVRLQAFDGLSAPVLGQKFFFSPTAIAAGDYGALVRDYTPYAGPGRGGDAATFFLGTLVSWFPYGFENWTAPRELFPPLELRDPSKAFGHLVRDGDDRECAVVLASEFTHVPACHLAMHYRWREAFGGSSPQHSGPFGVDPGYEGPAAMIGHRFLYEVISPLHGMSVAGNLRPIKGGPRG